MAEHFNGTEDYHNALYDADGVEISDGDFNLFLTEDYGNRIHFVGYMFYGKPFERAEPCYSMRGVRVADCEDYYQKSAEELAAMAEYIESIIPTSGEIQAQFEEINEWYEQDAWQRGQDNVREWDE